MKSCRDFEGAIAASLYEALDPAEGAALEKHLATCPACRQELERLRAFTTALPRESFSFQGDLRPVLRAEVAKQARGGWRVLTYRFGLIAVVAALAGAVILLAPDPGTPQDSIARVETNPVDLLAKQARDLIASGRSAEAMTLLESAASTATEPETAGAIHLLIADIEYVDLRRYDESFGRYWLVRKEFQTAWAASPGTIKDRYDILAEAAETDFDPLYKIDTARNMGAQGMPLLEQTLARHPGRGLARVAVETMAALAQGEGLQRLENARAQCSDPLAVAQLDVFLGERYCTEGLDPDRGRALLHAVAGSPLEIPARMANEALAKLETRDGSNPQAGS